MYRFIVRNNKGTGHAVFYDEKTSKMNWFTGGIIEDPLLENIEIQDSDIKDFLNSIKIKRNIEELDNFYRFKEECMHCPVVQLCKGKCLDDENFKESCNQSYSENVLKLYHILYILTAMKLESIDGDIRRPE